MRRACLHCTFRGRTRRAGRYRICNRVSRKDWEPARLSRSRGPHHACMIDRGGRVRTDTFLDWDAVGLGRATANSAWWTPCTDSWQQTGSLRTEISRGMSEDVACVPCKLVVIWAIDCIERTVAAAAAPRVFVRTWSGPWSPVPRRTSPPTSDAGSPVCLQNNSHDQRAKNRIPQNVAVRPGSHLLRARHDRRLDDVFSQRGVATIP